MIVAKLAMTILEEMCIADDCRRMNERVITRVVIDIK